MSIERIYITAGPYQDIISGIQMILSFSDGVVKLTGQEGVGKTSLLQKLQAHMAAEDQQTLLFSPPPKSVLELHNTVTRTYALGADVSFRKSLARHLSNQSRDKQNLVMLFDDADNMDDETLCDLLLFRNVKNGDQALVSLVLFGSADLDQRLSAPELSELVKDIVLNYELNPLNPEELAAFCKEAIPALGLRIALPSAQQLESLLAETRGYPGVVLERLPMLGAQASETGAPQAQTDTDDDDYATSTPGSHARAEVQSKAPLSLVPKDDEDDEDDEAHAGKRKALVGGLALAASLAAVYFLYPIVNDMLRPPAPTVATLPAPAPAPAVVVPEVAEPELTSAPEEPVVEEVAQIPAEPEEIAAVEDVPPTDIAVAEPEAPQADIAAAEPEAPQADIALAEPEAPPADIAIAEPEASLDETPQVATTPASSTTASLIPTFPASNPEEMSEENLEAMVREWLSAWQNQDLEGYFSAYHTDFAPLYQSTRSAWRDNRVRSIERPAAISIAMEDFVVNGDTDVGMQVSFWMEYQSGGYADRTRKELVIGHDVDGSLRILQEINRQVVAIAPGEITLSEESTQLAASGSTPSSYTEIGPPVPMGSVYSLASVPTAAAGINDSTVDELNDFLGSWLNAWQSQNLVDYFSHYHPAFASSAHASRSAWERDRTSKITRPIAIQIHLLDLAVDAVNAGESEVTLRMEYHSSYYADRTLKDISLARTSDGSWGIVSERNLQVTPLPVARLVPDRSITMRGGPNTVFEFAL